MIVEIFRCIINFLIALCISYMIYFNIVHFYSRWKCRKKKYMKPVKTCHEDDCLFARCCGEYEYLLSEEEAEKLERLIDELKN